jgi:polysaccharide biosynthesis/export protein
MVRTPPSSALIRTFECLLAIASLFIADSAGAQARAVAADSTHSQSDVRALSKIGVGAPSASEAEALAAIQSDESRIGPGDLLDISVFEAPEMNRTLRVSASGEISLELLGEVMASGLTPRELESSLQERLRRTYMKDPHVGVFLRELQSHAVSVVGAVKKPGVFQIQGTKTVLEMLSMAEGPADDAGATVFVMRGAAFRGTDDSRARKASPENAGEIDPVNLWDLMESSNSALNLPVYPGDIVKVTSAELVYVVGEVRKAGGFAMKNNQSISLLQALALAEGLTHTAATSQARIVRADPKTGGQMEIPVNLGKILANKAPDPGLQPKDILFVPNSSAKSAFYRGAESAVSMATGVAIYKW